MSVTGNAPIGSLFTGPLTADLVIWECADCKALINDVTGHEAWHAGHPEGGSEPLHSPWAPRSWWRVIGPDGTRWCETSDEEEARGSMRPGDRLMRLHTRRGTKWVPVECDSDSQ